MTRHYQDDPDFIGPRLPPDHPAYIAYLMRAGGFVALAPEHAPSVQARIDVFVPTQDLIAALDQHGTAFAERLADAIRTVIPNTQNAEVKL